MLQVIPIYNNTQNTTLFENLFDAETLWVVANSESKRRLQNLYLKDKKIISTQNIMRATEYWSSLLVVNAPQWQLISDSLIYSLIEEWYESQDVDVQYQDIQRFKTYCDQVFPLLLSDQQDLFKDWISADVVRAARLSGWTEMAESFLKYINKFHFVGQRWCISTLLQCQNIHFGQYKHYVFDLGNDIQPEEINAILRLSEIENVTVIAPCAEYLLTYRSGRSYTKLESSYCENKRTDATERGYSLRSPSVLAEVKTVTAHIRSLLDSGVSAQEIALVSADPESYWDVLNYHLEAEGIPVDKSLVVKYGSLPVFQDWISKIKVMIQNFSSGDLESVLISQDYFSIHKKNFLEFKKNFSRLYDSVSTENLLKNIDTKSTLTEMSFSDFISFLYTTWTHAEYGLFNKIVDALIKDYHHDLRFSLEQWFSYLCLILSRLEAPLTSAAQNGISFTTPHQLDHFKYTHLFVLGCHRGALQITTDSPFTPEDVSRLENDLGFYLPPYEDKKVEYDILWLLSRTEATVIMSYAETDFNADPCVVSQVWLSWSQKHPTLDISRKTRFDYLMLDEKQKFDSLNEPGGDSLSLSQKKMKCENSIQEWHPLAKEFSGRLSVSALQKYHECPFVFFMTRVLKKEEIKEFDLDIDPLFQGSFLHKILELIMVRSPGLDISRDDLELLYSEVLSFMETDAEVSRDVLNFWKREKHRHLLMLEKFLENEKDWRQKTPQTHFKAAEVDVAGYIGVANNELVLQQAPQDGFFPFAAKVDRIDEDQFGTLAIFDYKTSKPSDFKAFEKWPETFQIQMPLYAIGVEAGLADKVSATPVAHAGYIFLRDGARGSGYVLQGIEHGFKNVSSGKSKQNITLEQRDLVFQQLKTQIKDMILNIQKGEFKPLPLDPHNCPNCHWRKTCRAPHLK